MALERDPDTQHPPGDSLASVPNEGLESEPGPPEEEGSSPCPPPNPPTELLSPGDTFNLLKRNRYVKQVLEKAGPPNATAFAGNLDPSTYKVWLLLAKARLAELTSDQLARLLEMDEEAIRAIVEAPSFLHFESVFRQVMTAPPQLAQIHERLGKLMTKALDAWDHWVEVRDPQLAMASLSAAKSIAAAFGIDTERKRTVKVSVKADVPIGMLQRLGLDK